MKTLVVGPNQKVRDMGFPTELRVGWKQGDSVYWWGSTKNEDSLRRLIEDARSRYGEFEVERQP